LFVSAVWDTGASITVVDEQLVKDHPSSFQRIGDSTGTDANGNAMQTPTYLMTGMIIDGYVFPAHHVAAVDLSQVNAALERKMELILGYSSFRFANWWIDFPAKKWKITKFRGKAKI
jgi:hypothetical protein